MSASPFTVTEHTVDAQYMREFAHATTTEDAPLKLLVKKYTPVDNPNPQPGDVTLVGFHGAGFPKELYEPLWDELHAKCTQAGTRIRAVWIADVANENASGVYNERYLGNDPSWLDHSRDMLLMMNHFRREMPQPIVGVGHSMGTTQLIFLSLMHPRLFTSLILIEPFMADRVDMPESSPLLLFTLHKRDLWPSREVAAEKSRKLFKYWDERVFNRWVEHGYRDLPTVLYPEAKGSDSDSKPVTLTTTKHQELLMYARPNLNRHRDLGLSLTNSATADDEDADEEKPPHDPLFYPDVMGKLPKGYKFYRSDSLLAWKLLPHVRPSVLYIGGGKGAMVKSGMLARGAKRTGTRWGGSGGIQYGRVKHITIPGAGHDLPFQQGKISETADRVAEWIQAALGQWRADQQRISRAWEGLQSREKAMFREEWKKELIETMQPKKAKL